MSNHLYRLLLQVPHESAEAFAEAIENYCDTVAWTECQGETTAKVTGFSLNLPKEQNNFLKSEFRPISRRGRSNHLFQDVLGDQGRVARVNCT